jgi:hypothetical protein
MNGWSKVGLVLAMFAGASYWIQVDHFDWEDLKKVFPFMAMYLAVKFGTLLILGREMARSGKIQRFKKTLRLDLCATGIAAVVCMVIWALSHIPKFF